MKPSEFPRSTARQADETPQGNRMGEHKKSLQSPIAGLKPFLLVGLLVVIGLLVGLGTLLNQSNEAPRDLASESVTGPEEGLVPGGINIGQPPDSPKPDNPPSTIESGTVPETAMTPSEFTFYETLKKKPDEPAGTVGLLPKAPPAATATAPVTKMAKPTTPPPAARRPALSTRVIETASVNNSTLHYTVQVGAFRQQPVAQQLVAELHRKGHDAYLISAQLPDGMTYRVRVGRFTTRDEASRVAKQLAAMEGLHPFVATVQPNS